MKLRLALLLSAALLAQCAASRTFRCEQVWKNASGNNQPADCISDTGHLQKVLQDDEHLPHVVWALIPLVMFIIGFLCCPLVTIGRYCCKCCGGYRRRPGHGCCGGGDEWDNATDEDKALAYPASEIRNTKICAVLLVLLGFGFVLCGIAGTSILNEAYESVFTETKGLLTWVDDQALGVRTVMTINETQELIPPLEEDFFDGMSTTIDDFRDKIDGFKGTADPYVENVNLAALIIAITPLIFLTITLLCAICDIRTGLPCCNVCCHYLFVILYGIFGFVFLLVALVVGDVCGEREAFLDNSDMPSLMSLSMVPLCKANLPFNATKIKIEQVVTTQAGNACKGMRQVCDSSATWDYFNPMKVYQCPTLGSGVHKCKSFDDANKFLLELALKTDAPVECRTDLNDASTAFTPCTPVACATSCTQDEVREAMNMVVTAMHYAVNAEYAYDAYIKPLLDCVTLYSQALRPLNMCPQLEASFQLVGTSFLGFTFLFLVGLVVLWRGQKRFVKQPAQEEHDSDMEMGAEDGMDEMGNLTLVKKVDETGEPCDTSAEALPVEQSADRSQDMLVDGKPL
jgi:uncharacterized membrane protein